MKMIITWNAKADISCIAMQHTCVHISENLSAQKLVNSEHYYTPEKVNTRLPFGPGSFSMHWIHSVGAGNVNNLFHIYTQTYIIHFQGRLQCRGTYTHRVESRRCSWQSWGGVPWAMTVVGGWVGSSLFSWMPIVAVHCSFCSAMVAILAHHRNKASLRSWYQTTKFQFHTKKIDICLFRWHFHPWIQSPMWLRRGWMHEDWGRGLTEGLYRRLTQRSWQTRVQSSVSTWVCAGTLCPAAGHLYCSQNCAHQDMECAEWAVNIGIALRRVCTSGDGAMIAGSVNGIPAQPHPPSSYCRYNNWDLFQGLACLDSW